jgi:peptidoglycan/xylan/chitin deacetylase (PgdA/CDA1 family)
MAQAPWSGANSPACHLNPAHAQGGPGLLAPPADPIVAEPGIGAPSLPGSPLLDEELRDIAELGHGAVMLGEEAEHMVAFTFDDGPKETTTPRVLEALARYDVPATFFVVGWRFHKPRRSSPARAAILRDILAAGHIVGNHTYNHKNLAESEHKLMRSEIDRNTAALIEHLGYRPHAFRPPYGAVNNTTREHLRREGLTEMRWAIDSLDFHPDLRRTLRRRTVGKILERNGGVVLMHDTKEATAKNIAGILDDLERENCARLARAKRPILPVSVHYFIREPDGTPRPIPAHVAARTERYRQALPGRCAARAKSDQ